MESPSSTSAAADPAQFRTTHWSAVLAAAQSPGPQAAVALESLCELAALFRGDPKVWLEFSRDGQALFGAGTNGHLPVWRAAPRDC